jgi:CRISPR-associated protein Cas1
MPVVYIKEQGAAVRKRGGRILVEKKGEILLELPLRQTLAVAVFGNVQVTTQALSELLDRGIGLTLFTRNGRLKGHLAPEAGKNIAVRLAHYKAATTEAAALAFARDLVAAKLSNSAATVRRYRSNYASESLAAAERKLVDAAEAAQGSRELAELLGREGAGAAAYFEAFREMNRSALPFEGRRKHPAPDPINALLSLSYTMAMSELRGAVEAAGLDPFLGFLHQPDWGRPSLALDLLEPFRGPLADRLTLRLVNQRIFKEEDFARRVDGPLAGSVVLMPTAWERYILEYERTASEPGPGAPRGLREAMRDQVESLCATLRDGSPFRPFREES